MSAIATALLGVGVTLASTFASSLGLSVHQQRIGFGFGVVLLLVGVILYLKGRGRLNEADRREPEAPSPPSTLATGGRSVTGFDESALRRAIANALTELEAIELRLKEAGRSGHLAVLPAHHHQPLADLFTDRGWTASRRILDQAYNACDALRHRLDAPSRRWEPGPIPEMTTPTIEDSDDLPGVLGKVRAAIADLRTRQGESSSAPGEARLEFGAVEVGPSRAVREPNVFHESWPGLPVIFHLVNPRGSERARAIRPTVTVKDLEGEVLAGPTDARWSSPSSPNGAEVERDIPANGAPVAIDTVIQRVGEGGRCWLVTDEGLRRGLRANTEAIASKGDLFVTVSVQGENVAPMAKTCRVRLGFPGPTIEEVVAADVRDVTRVNIASQNQSGGITAHTVNVTHEPPELESWVEGGREFRDGFFVATVVMELSGYPRRLGLSAESAGTIEDLSLRKEGSPTPLPDERSRRTEGGGIIRSCGNPQPGRYVAEILTRSDMDHLHVEPWFE